MILSLLAEVFQVWDLLLSKFLRIPGFIHIWIFPFSAILIQSAGLTFFTKRLFRARKLFWAVLKQLFIMILTLMMKSFLQPAVAEARPCWVATCASPRPSSLGLRARDAIQPRGAEPHAERPVPVPWLTPLAQLRSDLKPLRCVLALLRVGNSCL